MDVGGVWTTNGKRYDLAGKLITALDMHWKGPISSVSSDGAITAVVADPDPDGDNLQFVAAFDGAGKFLWQQELALPSDLNYATARVQVRPGEKTITVVYYGAGCRPEGSPCFDSRHRQLRPLNHLAKLLRFGRNGKREGETPLGDLSVTRATFSSTGVLALGGTSDRADAALARHLGSGGTSLPRRHAFVMTMNDAGRTRWARALVGPEATLADVTFAANGTLWVSVAACTGERPSPATLVGGAAPVPMGLPDAPAWMLAFGLTDAGEPVTPLTAALPAQAPGACETPSSQGKVGLLNDGTHVFLKVDDRVFPSVPAVPMFAREPGTPGARSVVRVLAGPAEVSQLGIARGASSLVGVTVHDRVACAGFRAWGFGAPEFGCEGASPSSSHVSGLVVCAPHTGGSLPSSVPDGAKKGGSR
jgi:hypothetical protein